MTLRRAARPGAADGARLSDADVLARVAAGEIGAMGALYDRYHDRVRRFLRRATSDAHDVDDLVHATFLEVARSAARYDGRPSCRPWLVGIAAQLLRRRRRSFAQLVAVLSSLAPLRGTPGDPGPMLHAKTDLERALARLSEAKRITLLMAEVEGLTCPEIARALGVPVGTVWTRLHAARRELRHSLGKGDV